MSDVPITVASGEYDRIRAIRDGTVKVEGCAVTYHVVEPNQLFVRNLKAQEFDVSEMSFSTYIALRDQGKAHYTAIPVFLSRAFRHSAIFVRTDRGIASPADLKGKRVGTPEYFTTMLVWMRGLLSDEYGIRPSDLRWRLGPLEQPAPLPARGTTAFAAAPSPSPQSKSAVADFDQSLDGPKSPPPYPPPLAGEGREGGRLGEGRGGGSSQFGARVPPGPTPTPDPSPAEPRYSEGSAIQQSDRSRQQPTSVGGGEKGGAADVDIEAIPAGKTLAGMLAEGELDAVFSARPPSCFVQPRPRMAGSRDAVARLFPDYRAAEQAYYRKAGVYPLMHAVGVRNKLLAQHPWMAGSLFDAFAKAKEIAVADFGKLSAFAVTLPWIEAEYRATQAVLGEDIWPYGVAANRKAIETLCRYLHEQGFTRRRMGVDELFAPQIVG